MSGHRDVLRYAAFSSSPAGGNPAGVVLDASELSDAQMLATAADVGYSETAFVVAHGVEGDRRANRVRYFSPISEVPFCGHATLATAVALAQREGTGGYTFHTPVGEIPMQTWDDSGAVTASFTSVEPRVEPFPSGVLDALLDQLGVTEDALQPDYPPRISFAGNPHPVLMFADRDTFDGYRFDPASLRRLMDQQGWTGTVTTLLPVDRSADPAVFDARNPFPVGAITEDPATGSAAASLGGYLRALDLISTPGRVTITQGSHVGRPSVLHVDIPASGGITVSGTAVEIPHP